MSQQGQESTKEDHHRINMQVEPPSNEHQNSTAASTTDMTISVKAAADGVTADKDETTTMAVDEETTETKPGATNNEAASEGTNLQSPAWDHSDRRVMLQGVSKYQDIKTVRKVVNKLVEELNEERGTSVAIDKAKKPPNKSWMTVTLTQVDMVQTFIEYINEKNIKCKGGQILFAKRSDQVGDSRNRKRRGDDDADDDRGGKRRNKQELTAQARRPVTQEEIKAKICPLWQLSEKEQSQRKLRDMIRKSSMKIISEIKNKFHKLEKEKRKKIPLYDWIAQKRSIEVKDVIPVPSPIRNKVEFTFGYRYLFDETKQSSGGDPSTEPPKVPAVGFMVLGWAGGVSRPHGCPNIGPEFCAVSDLFDEFLKDSPLSPYDSVAHQGFWRLLTVRASRRTRQCMIIVTHTPSSGGQGEAVEWSSHVDKEKERLVQVLKSAELPLPDQDPIRITSVYFQEFEGLSAPGPDVPVNLAFGKPTIEEHLGKCTFHISPGAFFQVNTPGAEILYQQVVEKVREVSDDPQKTLLFDVCCGTGTIGLTCMKEGVVAKVVGIDISVPAIEDAKTNAKANGFKTGDNDDGDVSTTRFVASRAEHVMNKEICEATKSFGMKFVAVVDPSREGLHADVLRALRANEKINRIVYVSCNPTGSLIKDAALLCSPPTKKYSGTPFRVESAQPVDMFPLTNHCEMVMIFDRLRDAPKARPKTHNEATRLQGDEVVSEEKTTTNGCNETIESEINPEA